MSEEKFLENPFENIPSIEEAISISKKYGISLHPRYIFYWNELNTNELVSFLSFLKRLKYKENKIILPKNKFKRDIEKLGIEHSIEKNSLENVKAEDEAEIIIIDELNSQMLITNLELDVKNIEKQLDKLIETTQNNLEKKPCEIITMCNSIEIRDKGGSYIGARMGRPEKAKMRKLDGRPQGLFPIGEEGGRLRNIMEAVNKKGKIESEFAIFYNDGKESIYGVNKKGEKLEKGYFERYTGKRHLTKKEDSVRFKRIELELEEYIKDVREILGSVELPKMVKGIKGTTNKHHVVEHLCKAFLREKNNVYVNKDGTVRYDMIEMGLTHFKAKEIGTSIEKLKELGYSEDMNGDELVNDEQLIEIFPQDVILPDCAVSGDELASDFVINTGNFVDELLEKLYKLPKFYNFKTKEDTIGHLLIGLAPHTSAGIIGRIIGYSKTQGCFSHPVWHAAQRRNLDGDENGVMLLLDGLVNFSREYLPNRRGAATMDTSLVLTSHLYLDQIDDEVHGMDIVDHYPLEFYRGAKEYKNPKDIKIKRLNKKLSEKEMDKRYLGYKFTHTTSDMNDTILCSAYKSLPTMKEKMDKQLEIGKKIRAVDENQVGSFIIDKHFMKDIKGNLRKFGMQSFRCTNCNEIYRRPPLNGKCAKCKAPSINFTIHEGSIKKYLEPSFEIVKNYKVDPYIVETLELVNSRIEGVFGKELEKQKSLNSYFGK